MEALVEGMAGKMVNISVMGPLGKKADCVYGLIPDKNLAIIEAALQPMKQELGCWRH